MKNVLSWIRIRADADTGDAASNLDFEQPVMEPFEAKDKLNLNYYFYTRSGESEVDGKIAPVTKLCQAKNLHNRRPQTRQNKAEMLCTGILREKLLLRPKEKLLRE